VKIVDLALFRAVDSRMAATFTLVSCIRGYHVYTDVWDPSLGESVKRCKREDKNPQDPYAARSFDILASGIWSFITLTTRNYRYILFPTSIVVLRRQAPAPKKSGRRETTSIAD